MSEGYRLVCRILIRRRMKCQREQRHTIGYCLNCGVHQ